MNCPDCSGTCRVLREKCTVDGIEYPEMLVDCFRCNGTGELCDVCGEAADVCDGFCNDNHYEDDGKWEGYQDNYDH